MLPYLVNYYGNPHSRTHAYGWESEKAMEKAREVSSMRVHKVLLPLKENSGVAVFLHLHIVIYMYSHATPDPDRRGPGCGELQCLVEANRTRTGCISCGQTLTHGYLQLGPEKRTDQM